VTAVHDPPVWTLPPSEFNRLVASTTSVFTGSSGRVNSTAGTYFRTLGNARQIQFALRFSF